MTLSKDSGTTEEHVTSGNNKKLALAGAEAPVKKQQEEKLEKWAGPCTPRKALGTVRGGL